MTCQCEHYLPQKDTVKVTLHTFTSKYEIRKPIYEHNSPASSLRLTLQYKFIPKLTLATSHYISVQDDNELYDFHITSCHPLQYNPRHYHLNTTTILSTLTKRSYLDSISHHTYPLRFSLYHSITITPL